MNDALQDTLQDAIKAAGELRAKYKHSFSLQIEVTAYDFRNDDPPEVRWRIYPIGLVDAQVGSTLADTVRQTKAFMEPPTLEQKARALEVEAQKLREAAKKSSEPVTA